jgi:hypothetical protein
MKNSTILLSTILTGMLLSGCGSDSGSTITSSGTALTTSGQLVDSYIENVDYTCGDGTRGTTDNNGSFNCKTLPVTFSLKGLKLGEVATVPSDKQIFPQDLVGVSRADINNTNVLAMARFLQSCDDDNNAKNGINIREEVRTAFADKNETFNADNLDAYAQEAHITLKDTNDTLEHLSQTTTFVDAVDSVEKLPQNVKEALLTPASTLTQEVKNTLSYMGNEERLAYDVYNYLYNYHLNNGEEITQLTNIATKAEYTHIETVQLLVKKYITSPDEFTNVDMPELGYKDTDISNMQAGTYDIQTIQNLYDFLTAKGEESKQAALEVGCMVEVTDINDLLVDIQAAKDSNASDVVTAFEFLRDGSYSHYWAFDKGLKNMNVTDGCCVLGDKYCHPEYPQEKNGDDYNENEHAGNGNGQHKGKQ